MSRRHSSSGPARWPTCPPRAPSGWRSAACPVAVVRTEGEVFALHDVCSHEEVPLSEGEIYDHTVECWLHGSCFDLRTGKPDRAARHPAGADLPGEDRGRRRVRLRPAATEPGGPADHMIRRKSMATLEIRDLHVSVADAVPTAAGRSCAAST